MSIKEFSGETGIPASTLYKIISEEGKDFRRSTLRQIVEGVKKLEGSDQERVLGIITTRTALDTIGRTIEVDGKTVAIKEFPATTIEEAIIQGVRAEKAGVKGIICGPIAATTLERVVDIPITAFRFDEELLMDAISKLADKI
ncbi:transcriptional regulator [Candidatus Bathyarchaeota archaeon]|nr:transcriptional regulator [Candidatus Bathyarchaeota archaeon]